MTEKDFGERLARIEGAHDAMVAQSRRDRLYDRAGWIVLVAFLVIATIASLRVGEFIMHNCALPWQ